MRSALRIRHLLLAALVGVVTLGNAVAAPRAEQRPKLVLLIVIDQLRADYLFRWSPHFRRDGFRKLMDEGAYFENGFLSYSTSATGPGHATIATGRLPRQHGIIGNEWFLTDGLTKPETSVHDPNTKPVGLNEPTNKSGQSPWRLIGNTLGDQMKLADRRSRVFSVSLKDRAAIPMGGIRPDGVFWWQSGRILTSTYYLDRLPDYLDEMNRQRFSDRYAGKVWDRLRPAETYVGTQPLKTEWHEKLERFGSSFPHKLPDADKKDYYELLRATPFGNDIVFEMAYRLVTHEKLGRGPAPDLLCISLSAYDYVGHAFGPDSAELMDMTLRTDEQLADFLGMLDAHLGLDRCLIALTADHGMSSAPPVSRLQGLGADYLDVTKMIKDLRTMLRREFDLPADGEPLVLGCDPPNLYCDGTFRELDRRHNGELSRKVVQFLLKHPGIEAVYTAHELSGPSPSRDDLGRFEAWRCYHPERSGQFYLKLSPFWFEAGDDLAGHSAGFRSDRHIPILFYGSGVRTGRHFDEVDATDIAPTIASLLGVEAPINATGRVLSEALTGVKSK